MFMPVPAGICHVLSFEWGLCHTLRMSAVRRMEGKPGMMGLVLIFLLCLVTAGQVDGQERGREKRSAVSREVMALYEPGSFKGMPYRLMKPLDFDPQMSYPLVVSLHGAGGRGTDNIKSLRNWNALMAKESLRRQFPAFVLVPQTPVPWFDPTSSRASDDTLNEEVIGTLPEAMRPMIRRRLQAGDKIRQGANLDKVIELIRGQLMKDYKIDEQRVYCLGHSMGGAGTWTALYQHPDFFAAGIPTAGVFGPWRDITVIQDIPIWVFHGDDDPVVPYIFSAHAFIRMKAVGGNMKFTTLKGAKHGAAMPAFNFSGDNPENGSVTQFASDNVDKTENVWVWLFNQKRDRQDPDKAAE